MICSLCGTGGIKAIAELWIHRGLACDFGGWAEVAELRRAGKVDEAVKAARRAMGIKGEPMDEETKEKLRQYKAAHAEEIKARAELEAATRARMRAIMKPVKDPRRRK